MTRTPILSVVSTPVLAVEEMQEGTRQEEQVGEDAQDVGDMLGHDEEGGDREKGEQHQTRA